MRFYERAMSLREEILFALAQGQTSNARLLTAFRPPKLNARWIDIFSSFRQVVFWSRSYAQPSYYVLRIFSRDVLIF